MPFPWKKNRVPRISQFVADLQSPKRGGSLVVETGFPTSLIDLFVKNRNRFKTNRSKRNPSTTTAADPPPPPPPPPPPSPVTSPPPHVPVVPSSHIEENDRAVSVPDRVTECSHGSGLNAVVFVKLLMVLAVVASVKRLTVGITVSAFALLLLEYAGRRVVWCSVVESWFQKVVKKERVGGFGNGFAELTHMSSQGLSIDEIEVVEAISDVGICCDVATELLLEDDSSKKVFYCEDEISECKIRGSRSGRFKSKMVKKFVPKKFRGCKKEKKGESGSEVSSAVEEDKLLILEIDEEEDEEEIGDKDKLSNTNEIDSGITNEKRVDRVGKWGSSMVLVVIALAGLILGRFPALILMMTWCCLMKIVRTLWRSRNVPLVKCCVSNS